jgi:LacI family transcriptional regulator
MKKKKTRLRGRPAEPDARYRRVAEKLRTRIEKGEWPAGSALPSIRDLAAEYQEGDFTVRLAAQSLRAEGFVRINPRRRMVVSTPTLRCNAAFNPVLEVLGRGLHLTHGHPTFDALQRGICIGAGQIDRPLLIVHDRLLRNELPVRYLRIPLEGVLLVGPLSPQIIARYEKLNVPTVLVDMPGAGPKLHEISVDNETSAFEATRHLIALGHRRIAFVRFVQLDLRDIDPDSKQRQKGFGRALRRAGISSERNCIFNIFSKDGPDSPSLRALFQSQPPFTAALVADDEHAGAVLKAARRFGKKVPDDFSIACWMQKTDPPAFGGMQIDFQELGRQAVHLLNKPRQPAQHVKVQTIWTTGPTVAERRPNPR